MNAIELSLTILSDSLLPEEMSSLIGSPPTSSQTKGESHNKLAPPFKRNDWTLEFGTTADVELKSLKQKCFQFISSHRETLSQLTMRDEIQAFLTFYIRTGGYHVGLELELEEMQVLVETRIFPTFSIYSIE